MAIFAKGVALATGLTADLYITGAYITTLRGGKQCAARFEGFASAEHSRVAGNAVWGLEVEFEPKPGELWPQAYDALKALTVEDEEGKQAPMFPDAKNV